MKISLRSLLDSWSSTQRRTIMTPQDQWILQKERVLAWLRAAFSTVGAATPFFVYYFFPIITASSRYGIRGGLSAAIAGAVIYGFIRFHFDWEDSLGIDRFVVRSIYLFVLAYIFGFLSEFETRQNQKLLALSKTAGAVATL